MRRILVSGASGVVGYGILRSLRKSGQKLSLIGTSIYDDSVAPAFCDIFERALPTNHANYMEWLLGTVRKHQAELVIPGIDVDMYEWAAHASEIRSSGAVPLLNNLDLIKLCGDKWAFYENIHNAGMSCAIESSLSKRFDELAGRYGLPFLLKPRHGFGSKGIVRISSAETFAKHQNDMGTVLLAQPIVGNDEEEFTTSAFCDGDGGFWACMTLRRKLSSEGFTEKAEVSESGEFKETMSNLCRHFRPIGPTNFQFRRCASGIMLLEINPRVSSSTSIRAAFGYNESAMAVDYFLENRQPSQPTIRRGRAVRYVEEQVFYEDGVYL